MKRRIWKQSKLLSLFFTEVVIKHKLQKIHHTKKLKEVLKQPKTCKVIYFRHADFTYKCWFVCFHLTKGTYWLTSICGEVFLHQMHHMIFFIEKSNVFSRNNFQLKVSYRAAFGLNIRYKTKTVTLDFTVLPSWFKKSKKIVKGNDSARYINSNWRNRKEKNGGLESHLALDSFITSAKTAPRPAYDLFHPITIFWWRRNHVKNEPLKYQWTKVLAFGFKKIDVFVDKKNQNQSTI